MKARAIVTAASAALILTGVSVPSASASAACTCRAPRPAYLIPTGDGGPEQIVGQAYARLAARTVAYDETGGEKYPGTIYRLACRNSTPRARDKVSVRRVRHHKWGAFDRFGRHLIFRFSAS